MQLSRRTVKDRKRLMIWFSGAYILYIPGNRYVQGSEVFLNCCLDCTQAG